jgi:hypothetical protein
MAIETPETPAAATPEEEYAKPNPQDNPRNIALGEIAKTVAAKHVVDAAETAPTVDEEGHITPPPGETPPNEPPAPAEDLAGELPPEAPPPAEQPAPAATIDPLQDYDVVVDGQKMKVKGKAIIDAGYRTFQKETAADFRLQMASELLKEAETKARGAAPQDAPPKPEPKGKTDAELANALQFGTPEQAAEALTEMRGKGAVSPEQVQQFAAQQARIAAQDELQFQGAMTFVQAEYADLLSNDYIKRLFFVEENRRRAPKDRGGEADRRPYKELYKSIGDDLRVAFKLPKQAASSPSQPTPPGTVAARQARKAETPPVPRTAATRLNEAAAAAKVATPSEVIAAMAAKRGQNQLVPQPRSKGT